jgi:DNA repair protein RecO (recombination protein O)
MIVTTEAIVLKSLKYRDSSKLLTVYTEQFGRCSLVANGARKPKNKFGSALEPMACSSLTFYKHPNKDLHTLSAAETALPLRSLTDSFERLTAGIAMLEAVYTTQHDEEQNPELYTLLKSSLVALNALPTDKHTEQTLVLWFQLRLAEVLGFALNPHYCADTGDEILPDAAPEFIISLSDGAPYSPETVRLRGSVKSGTGGSTSVHGFRMEAGTLAVLQRLRELPLASLDAVAALVLSARQQQQLGDFFALYYKFHIDRGIASRTRRFMRDV